MKNDLKRNSRGYPPRNILELNKIGETFLSSKSPGLPLRRDLEVPIKPSMPFDDGIKAYKARDFQNCLVMFCLGGQLRYALCIMNSKGVRQPQQPLPQWDNTTSVAAAISSQPPPIYEYMYHSGAQRYLSRPTPPQPPAPPSLNGMGFDDLSPYDFPCASASVSLLAPRQIKEEKLSRSPLMPLLGQDTSMSLDTPPNLRMCPQQIHYQNQHSQQQEQLQNEQQHYQEQQRALQEQQQQQLQEQQQEHQDEQQMQDSEPQQQQFQEQEQNSSEQHQQLSEQNMQHQDDHQSHSKLHNHHHFQQQNISNTTTSTTTTISLPGLVIESDGLPMETPKKSAARRVWSHTETKYFLNTMHRYYHNIQSACTNNQKGELWDRVVEEHNRHYPERSKRSCQQQWERLFCRYKATKRHNNQPGVTPVLFEYNEEIKAIVGEINSFTDTYEEKAGIYLDRFSLERFTLNRTSSSSSAVANIVSMPPIGFESSFLSFDSSASPIIESSLHGINNNNHHHNNHHPQNNTSNGSITLKRAAAEALMIIDEGTTSTSSIGINNSGSGSGGIINQQQRKNKKPKTNIEKLFELLERQHQEDQERKREERQRWEEYQRKNEEFKQQLVDAFNGLVEKNQLPSWLCAGASKWIHKRYQGVSPNFEGASIKIHLLLLPLRLFFPAQTAGPFLLYKCIIRNWYSQSKIR
ncbi:12901_t:CDS:2 [Ambispora gerdemannii]|uniref:12901_t:CDS:1 n=1 Tax=Ambispora gerdemannii TaxID=144530 RepID=A0A9N9A188_9GLOM|nr:12901_t:CDS:2 [Ambispora gerdemannii]